jgi:hypothetical protein
MIVRLCPLAKPLFDSLPKRIYTLSEGKKSSRLAFQLREAVTQSRVILPQNEIIGLDN